MSHHRRVAIVHPAADRASASRIGDRWQPMADALEASGLEVVWVPYAESRAAEVSRSLLQVHGALVWVDPLSDGGTRSGLDALLREAEARGVWIGSSPDVIDRLGTKEVLVATRGLSWGTDVHRYADPAQLRREFPARLGEHGVRVLKATRGNGGRTVWKVGLPPEAGQAVPDAATEVVVQHARARDGSAVRMPLGQLFEQVEAAGAFASWPAGADRAGGGSVVDQEFVPGVTRGIVRCYLIGDRVAGFARQYPAGVEPAGPLDVEPASEPSPDEVMGLPSSKTMYPLGEPAFAELRRRLEDEWVPGTARILALRRAELPALWDVDLLILEGGEPAAQRFALCEINASSVTPSPPAVPAQLAAYVATTLASRNRPTG